MSFLRRSLKGEIRGNEEELREGSEEIDSQVRFLRPRAREDGDERDEAGKIDEWPQW